MITLKTLHLATEQEVFDQVAKHLLTQNATSFAATGTCGYRGYKGLKCAAGCLIADDEYGFHTFEGRSWNLLLEKELVPGDHYTLIRKLQQIHDLKDVFDWKESLKELALHRQLEWRFE